MYTFQTVCEGYIWCLSTVTFHWKFTACNFIVDKKLIKLISLPRIWVYLHNILLYILFFLSCRDYPAEGSHCHKWSGQGWAFSSTLLDIQQGRPKLYIPSTINTDLIIWHTQWIMTAVKCLNPGLFLLLFKFLGWKYILNLISYSGLKSRLLHCLKS